LSIPEEDLKAIASILATGYLRHRDQLRRTTSPLDGSAGPGQTPTPQDPASRSADQTAAPEIPAVSTARRESGSGSKEALAKEEERLKKLRAAKRAKKS
jgi:hypothetical protein